MIPVLLLVFGLGGIWMALRPPLISNLVFAIGYGIVSIILIWCNAICFLEMRKTRKFCSAIPLIGGLYGAICLSLLGGALRRFFWVPLVLDWGTWIILITLFKLIVKVIREKCR